MKNVNLGVIVALDAIVGLAPLYVYHRRNEASDLLAAAAASKDDEFGDSTLIVKKVAAVLGDIAWDWHCDIENINFLKRRTQELGSILHIGRSYPDAAIRRASRMKREIDSIRLEFEKSKAKQHETVGS